MSIRKKYLKNLVSLISVFILVVVVSVIYEEYSASYGMGKYIITAQPFRGYVYIAKWQVKSGRAYEYLESIKSKANIEEDIRLFTFLPIFTGNYYSIGDGISESSNGTNIVLNKYMIEYVSNEALEGVLAHELGHFAKGHINPITRGSKTPIERQNEADE